ncbi:TPA: OmpA family protein [Photobacterium damselae]
MKLTLPLLLMSINMALSAPVFAQSTSPDDYSSSSSLTESPAPPTSGEASLPVMQNGHVYLGTRLGWANYQDACGQDALKCANDTFGFGLYGGYQFNDWFALEGGLTDYGSPDARYRQGTVSVDDMLGGEISAKLSYPLTERFDVYTRIGGAWQHIDKHFTPMPDSIESSQWNVLSAVGLDYRLSQRWSLRGEYQFIDGIGDGDVEQADLHFASFGLTYHFGQTDPVVAPKPKTPKTHYVTVNKKIHLDTQSLFGFDSSTLQPSADLKALVSQLPVNNQALIYITGYTDSSGSAHYNQKLSQKRAQAVKDYLVEQGVASARIIATGKGESNPIASNATAEGRAQNRRVDVSFDTVVSDSTQITDVINNNNV